MLLLYYPADDLFVLGFEDVKRDDKSCDHDFNDVVLYASSYPKTAISKNKVVVIDAPKDTDGDGIVDIFDEYPSDGTKAYNNYFPSQESWGTLAFEDNWPLKGDYDMNDLVVNYRYSFTTNAANKVVEIKADYEVVGALADYKNGFGVEFPFSPSLINDAKGYIHTLPDIQFNPNGTEAGQRKAVIIPFDNQKSIFDATTNYSEVVSMRIQFLNPQAMSVIGTAPFNPFLISNGRRVFEIHLPGYTPTDKGATSLFGQNQDQSNPSIGKFFIGENNWPWAIHFTEPFAFPKEGKAVNTAFLHFGEWAASGGESYPDWYTSKTNGYRNNTFIF
jgi:LruC domain-containing protein